MGKTALFKRHYNISQRTSSGERHIDNMIQSIQNSIGHNMRYWHSSLYNAQKKFLVFVTEGFFKTKCIQKVMPSDGDSVNLEVILNKGRDSEWGSGSEYKWGTGRAWLTLHPETNSKQTEVNKKQVQNLNL